MRIGFGYDVHAFEKGRKLILGGVEVPFELGLSGHSDADVLTHAIADSLLGSIKKRDIGYHFPDTDERYRDIDSLLLLSEVGLILKQNGYRPVNIDSVIVAQKPYLSDFIPSMEENIARALNMRTLDVSVKATTEEHMGFTGEIKGIKAYGVCLVDNINTQIHNIIKECGGK